MRRKLYIAVASMILAALLCFMSGCSALPGVIRTAVDLAEASAKEVWTDDSDGEHDNLDGEHDFYGDEQDDPESLRADRGQCEVQDRRDQQTA